MGSLREREKVRTSGERGEGPCSGVSEQILTGGKGGRAQYHSALRGCGLCSPAPY